MESGSSYCFYLGLSIANFSCSFFFNQLVCCGSWFKFTWQLQAKLTAHSWCWEHFCDVETILTHPTDYSWSPPNFRQPKTSVSSAKWWHQAYDYHHHHNLLVVDHCQWQCDLAAAKFWSWEEIFADFSVDSLMNLSLINFTRRGSWKIALELK